MTLKCDKDGQEFGSEIALSMHLKDKHGITDATETSKAVTKANRVPYKLSSLISKRKDIIISAVVIAVLILSISLLIPKSVNAQTRLSNLATVFESWFSYSSRQREGYIA
jgi:hypothetical protein